MTVPNQRHGAVGWMFAVLLGTALVLCVVVLLRLLTDGSASGPPDADTASAPQATVSSAGARAAARGAAVQATERVLSYSWKTLEADLESARAVTVGEMREQYDDTMAGIETRTVQDRVVVEASVVATGVISATDRHAKVLVFVDQSTTGRNLDESRTDRNRLVVTLRRGSRGWMIAELDAL